MPNETRIVGPGPKNGNGVRTQDGQILRVPDGWELLPPGDATLTRRVKAAGPSWTVKEKKGRRTFSHGVWAPSSTITQIRQLLQKERSSPAYAKRRAADAQRRDKKQTRYIEDFHSAVLQFLAFNDRHALLAGKLAKAVTKHATPIGSGTVARTKRIPVERRAEAAVIAWMRHQTTAYDDMKIARIRGKRRAVRRELAEQSKKLLHSYRNGDDIGAECPLQKALN